MIAEADLNKETNYRITVLRDMTVEIGGDGEGRTYEVKQNDVFEGQYELTTDKGNFLCFWVGIKGAESDESDWDYFYFPVDSVAVVEIPWEVDDD